MKITELIRIQFAEIFGWIIISYNPHYFYWLHSLFSYLPLAQNISGLTIVTNNVLSKASLVLPVLLLFTATFYSNCRRVIISDLSQIWNRIYSFKKKVGINCL